MLSISKYMDDMQKQEQPKKKIKAVKVVTSNSPARFESPCRIFDEIFNL